jgi:hypothetical protein
MKNEKYVDLRMAIQNEPIINDLKPLINCSVKTIYLHIGLHKTATSSIQNTLKSTSNILKEMGGGFLFEDKLLSNYNLYFLSLFFNPSNLSNINLALQTDLNQVEEFNKHIKSHIYSNLRKTKCKTAIYSAEALSGAKDMNVLNIMKAFFAELVPNANIKIVVYVREIVSYENSRVQQEIKVGSQSYNGYVKRFKKENYSLYETRLKVYLDCFGRDKIIIRKFEDACKHEFGPVGDFLETCGVPKDGISTLQIENANESLSDKSIEIIDYINTQVPLKIGNELNMGRFMFDTKFLNKIKGDKFALKPEDTKQLLENCISDKKWLKKNFGIEYPSEVKIRKQNAKLYDDQYVKDIKYAVKRSSKFINFLVYDFICKKLNTIVEEDSILALRTARNYVKKTLLDCLVDD